jgi:hypothetical protein
MCKQNESVRKQWTWSNQFDVVVGKLDAFVNEPKKICCRGKLNQRTQKETYFRVKGTNSSNLCTRAPSKRDILVIAFAWRSDDPELYSATVFGCRRIVAMLLWILTQYALTVIRHWKENRGLNPFPPPKKNTDCGDVFVFQEPTLRSQVTTPAL